MLASSDRTSGGHRIYDESGVERLYRIRALRGLGMSLEEIRQTIDGGAALTDTLRTHLTRVELEVERMTLLRDRLRSITRADTHISASDLLATLDAMSRIERHAHARRRNRTKRGEDAESRWRALGDELRACMEAGDKPSSERVKAVASQVRSLIHKFAGGDAAILEALARLRTVDPPRDLAGWDPELTRYLDLAFAALERK